MPAVPLAVLGGTTRESGPDVETSNSIQNSYQFAMREAPSCAIRPHRRKPVNVAHTPYGVGSRVVGGSVTNHTHWPSLCANGRARGLVRDYGLKLKQIELQSKIGPFSLYLLSPYYCHYSGVGSFPCIAAYCIRDGRRRRLERRIAILYACIATALITQKQFATVSSLPRYYWICTCLLCTLCMLHYIASAARARHY